MNKPQKIFKKRIISYLFNNDNLITFVSYSYMPLLVKKELSNLIISKQCNLTLVKNTLLQKIIKNTIYNKFYNIFYCPTAILNKTQNAIFLSEISNIFFDKKSKLTSIMIFLIKKPYFLSKLKFYLNLEKSYGKINYNLGIFFYLFNLLNKINEQ